MGHMHMGITYPVEFNVGSPTRWATTIILRTPQLVLFWVVEVILQTRIHAVYGSRRLAAFNTTIFILEIVLMVLLSVYFTMPAYKGDLRPIYIVPGLVFELWLAGLAAAKLKVARRRSWELITVIVTDSIVYFFLIAVTMLIYFIGGDLPIERDDDTFYGRTDYSAADLEALVWPFMVASQSIGASRLFLHLRKEYYRQHDSSSGMQGTLGYQFRSGSVQRPQQRGFVSSFVDEAFYESTPEDPNALESEPTTTERV